MNKHYSEKEKELIKKLYLSGFNTVQIALRVKKSQTGVERFLKREKIFKKNIYRHKIPSSEDIYIKQMYLENNNTTQEIAQHYQVTDTAILRLLNSWGIDTSDTEKYSKAKCLTAFNTIDSELKAYLLGFIFADGNISKPKNRPNSLVFQLEIQEQDKQILYWLADLIEYPYNNIATYQRPNRSPTSKISLYSKTLCQGLMSHGIIPRKSHLGTLPSVSEELQRHFLRGLFDGDGCVTGSKLELYNNKNVIDSIESILKNKGIPPQAIKKYKTSCYRLSIYQKQYRNQIGKWLYENCNYYLERKARYYREIVDKPLREFGKSPEKGNPEPNLGRNSSEGVTTNEYDPERIMNQHERGASRLQNKIPIFDIGGKFPPDIEWV